MFDKVKQGRELLKMRQQASKIQKQLADVTESMEKDGIKVKVSADQKVQYIEIDGEPQDDLVKIVNDAFKKVQKKAAQKMMEEQGLSGLLGGLGQ